MSGQWGDARDPNDATYRLLVDERMTAEYARMRGTGETMTRARRARIQTEVRHEITGNPNGEPTGAEREAAILEHDREHREYIEALERQLEEMRRQSRNTLSGAARELADRVIELGIEMENAIRGAAGVLLRAWDRVCRWARR